MELITRNTSEVITLEELRALLEGGRPSAYCGIAPTGLCHIGYLVPISKMIDLAKAGFRQKLLIADFHAYLDDRKTEWEKIEARARYYEECIRPLLPEGIEIIRGSEFQLNRKYVIDLIKALPLVTVARAKRAASEVCRMKNPKVSELVYPIMQGIDCAALEVDVVVGGSDQRHIYMVSREFLPLLKYKKPICIFTPLILSLKGGGRKISATEPGSGFILHDSEEKIRDIVREAYCPPEIEGNPILQLCKHIIFPLFEKLKIERDARFGGDVEYTAYEELEKSYVNKEIHPLDLKNGVAEVFIEKLKGVRKSFEHHPDIIKEAYSE